MEYVVSEGEYVHDIWFKNSIYKDYRIVFVKSISKHDADEIKKSEEKKHQKVNSPINIRDGTSSNSSIASLNNEQPHLGVDALSSSRHHSHTKHNHSSQKRNSFLGLLMGPQPTGKCDTCQFLRMRYKHFYMFAND